MTAMDVPLPFRAVSAQQLTIHAMFAAVQAQEERQAIEFMQWNVNQRERLIRGFFHIDHLHAVPLTTDFKALLRVESSAKVALYASSGQHTRVHHTKDAPEILLALPKSLIQLRYVGRDLASGGIFQLVFEHTPDAWICVPIKFIPAGPRASTDECWVRTAYKIKRQRLQGLIRHHNLETVT